MIEIEPVSGWKGRVVRCEGMTVAHYEIAAGASEVHEHRHPEEEAWSIIDGEVLIWVDGEERTLGAGDVAVIPPNVPHRLRPSSASRALVIDSPARRELPGEGRRPPGDR